MNNLTKQKGKISTGFIVLISIVLTVFVAVMIYILTLPTPEDLRKSESKRFDKVVAAETAARLGMSQEAYDKQQIIQKRDYLHANKIRSAIKEKDTDLIITLFKEVPDFDFSKNLTGIYREIAITKNEDAFRYVLQQDVPCDYGDRIGQYTFNALMQKGFEKYFTILIEHGCDITKEPGATNLKRIIAQSQFPERILLFPKNESNKGEYESAFFNSIAKRNTKAAFAFIDDGVDVNAEKVKGFGLQTALQLSIYKDLPEIAVRLLEKGAKKIKTPATNNYKKHLLLTALQKDQYIVVKAILERHPDYVTQEKIIDDYFTLALKHQGNTPELKTLLMKFNKNITTADFKDDGIHILFKAIQAGNYDLVEKLIRIGVELNKPLAMKTALGEAKRVQSSASGKISQLLIEKGAADDYLAIVREQRNVSSSTNCEVGNETSLSKIENQILELSKESKNKIFRNSKGMCQAVLKLCFTEGIGSDDCVKSVNTCDQTDSGNSALAAESKNICCSATFKQDYEQARCAGLNVIETFEWMDSQ